MMINKRLIGTVSESKKYVAGNVVSLPAYGCSISFTLCSALRRSKQGRRVCRYEKVHLELFMQKQK